jgi:hypothetical protein
MSAATAVHPRIMDRLEKTLALRLRRFESERDRTRVLIEGILDRLAHLERTSGMVLADCRDECGAALREIDALDVHAKDGGEEIERLVQRVTRIASLLSHLDASRLRA